MHRGNYLPAGRIVISFDSTDNLFRSKQKRRRKNLTSAQTQTHTFTFPRKEITLSKLTEQAICSTLYMRPNPVIRTEPSAQGDGCWHRSTRSTNLQVWLLILQEDESIQSCLLSLKWGDREKIKYGFMDLVCTN